MMSLVHHLLLHPTLFPISLTCTPNSSLHLAPRVPLAVDWTNFRVSNQSTHWNSKSESSVDYYLLFSSSSLASSHSLPLPPLPPSPLPLAPRMPLAADWTNFRVSNQSTHRNSKSESESSVDHYLLFNSSSLASSHSLPLPPLPPSPLHLAPSMILAADWTNFRVMSQSTHWNSKSESSVDHYLLLVVGKMPIYTTNGLLKGGCGNLQFLLYMVNVLHCAPLMILPVHTATDE